MNKRQESKLSMYMAVRDFLLKNSETTKGLPEFDANFKSFQETITEIQEYAERQKTDIKGFAREKLRLRETLVSMVLDNSHKLGAYASFREDIKLQTAVKMTRSKLVRAADTGVRDYAQIVFDMAESVIDNVTEFGITKETQSQMLEAINKYNAAIPGPRVAKTQNMQATKHLSALFTDADILLHAISAAIGIIRLSQPLFMKGFESAKKIVGTSTSAYSLRGIVTDSYLRTPVKGVKFRFRPQADALELGEAPYEIFKTSNKKGGFYVKVIHQGTYSVYISKPGYKDKTISVVVADGELTDVKVELEAA